jgi:hypothetical protein
MKVPSAPVPRAVRGPRVKKLSRRNLRLKSPQNHVVPQNPAPPPNRPLVARDVAGKGTEPFQSDFLGAGGGGDADGQKPRFDIRGQPFQA